MGRCKNRRAAVCPSCSDLYAGDTWHLVSAGITGAEALNLPATVATHPMVFATLTAPSYGPVHTVRRGAVGAARRCHPHTLGQRCPHGHPMWCTAVHEDTDPAVGQALCTECYDYRGHVLFSWHAPQLWHRFTITLRRLLARHLRDVGADPASVRVAHVKVVEMQTRGIPHVHTVIRLDDATRPATEQPAPPAVPVTSAELAGLIVRAARDVKLFVRTTDDEDETVRLSFGEQIDVQPITNHDPSGLEDAEEQSVAPARKVAGYLAKYVTKSVADFGLGHHRMSPLAIASLAVTDHVRRILATISGLAELPGRAEMLTRLHTRGHITTKTRHYSTTMGALRARRHAWRENADTAREVDPSDEDDADVADDGISSEDEPIEWTFHSCGHDTEGERLLAITAALHAREHRHTARDALTDQRAQGAEP